MVVVGVEESLANFVRRSVLIKTPMAASKLTFWKPGTTGPGSTLDRATEAEGNVVQSAPSYSSSVQSQRERLPIFKHS